MLNAVIGGLMLGMIEGFGYMISNAFAAPPNQQQEPLLKTSFGTVTASIFFVFSNLLLTLDSNSLQLPRPKSSASSAPPSNPRSSRRRSTKSPSTLCLATSCRMICSTATSSLWRHSHDI
jgi:hypothetical protein